MDRDLGKKQIFRKLYSLLDSRQKGSFVIIIGIMAVSAVLSQLTPKAIGWLTDDILTQEQIDFRRVVPLLLIILVINVVNELIKILRRVLVEDTATRTEKKARGMVVEALLKAPLAYFKENMTGNIHGRLNRCLEGTVRLEKLVFMDFAPAIFNSVAAVAVIFTTLPPVLALPMMLVIPIGTAIVLRQISTQQGIRVELLETKADMDGAMVELLNGIEVIRITDSVRMETDRFDERSEFLRAKEMRHHLQMAKYDSLKFLNQAVFTVLMIGVSAYLATRHVITVGSVLTAYLCFNQLIKPLEELHRILDELSESMVLAEDFFQMTEIPNDFSYQPLPAGEEEETGRAESLDRGESKWKETVPAVEIRDLTLRYDRQEEVLDGLNLTVEPGMFLGIAGPSGCGKSSLVKAICKLEACEGVIRIGGTEIQSLTRKDLSGIIALVPQNPFLIAGTIRENICYGLEREVPREEVEAAADKACLSEFISSLPEGVDTLLAEGGRNLSGGQKQRIAIARIFLRNPGILILDEATSALDNTSERIVQLEIEKLQKERGMTIISIAHRLTTLKNCDRIIVMDEGKIIESGRYEELLRQEGVFRDMYQGKRK